MKIAIVIGHNSKAQGAVRVTDGRTEFDWNGELAGLIQSHNPASVRVFRRERGGGYSAEIDRVYAEVDAWGADCSIELHFNGSVNPHANGGLTLSSGTRGSMSLAGEIRVRAAKALSNTDRGIRKLGRHDRGGRSLWQGKAPAVMTEPYFGSNASECLAAGMHMDELAEAYYRGAVAFLSKVNA
jgi:N-acetylmuramoyl-L-alanine amidase